MSKQIYRKYIFSYILSLIVLWTIKHEWSLLVEMISGHVLIKCHRFGTILKFSLFF